MSTDKKELWLIVSPTECKRVHDVVKPDSDEYACSQPGRMAYHAANRRWEEAERTLSIHPDCLEIKEGDEVWDFEIERAGCVVAIDGERETVQLDLAQDGTPIEEQGFYMQEFPFISKFPLNSIWHGEEREGKIWLTQQVQNCREEGCKELAVRDYNGHGHWVCQKHYDSLSSYFEEEYK